MGIIYSSGVGRANNTQYTHKQEVKLVYDHETTQIESSVTQKELFHRVTTHNDIIDPAGWILIVLTTWLSERCHDIA